MYNFTFEISSIKMAILCEFTIECMKCICYIYHIKYVTIWIQASIVVFNMTPKKNSQLIIGI